MEEADGVARGELGGAVGDAAEEVVEPVGVGLGEVAEDVGRDQALVAGVADADADAVEGRADVGVDRAQAVVAGVAAAGLDADPAGGEVELVVEDGDVVGLELVELQGGADASPERFMKVPGFRSSTFSAPRRPSAISPWNFARHGAKPWADGDGVDGHEADVVAVAGVLAAGIAEADEELHEAHPQKRKRAAEGRGASGCSTKGGGGSALRALLGLAFLGAQARGRLDVGDGEVAVGDDRRGARGQGDAG